MTTMRRARGLYAFGMLCAAASVMPGLVGCDKDIRDSDIKVMQIGEAKVLWDRAQRGSRDLVIFLDPRPTKEFEIEHIPGARNLQLPQAPLKGERDPGLERFDHIVVYGSDPGSATARGLSKRLLAIGYKGIRWFPGGMKEWKGRGYPLDGTGPPPAPAAKPEAGAPAHPAPGESKPEPRPAETPK